MEHLPVHLPYEAMVGGPIQYRWIWLQTHPATQSHPATLTLPTTQPLPSPGASSPQFYSADPRFPSPDPAQSTPFYPYYSPPPYAGAHYTYPFPPYAPPYYPPPPHHPSTTGPSTPASPEQATYGRMLIAPKGDT
ncbi:extensin-like [Dendrobium catenatum]|uniref:extensin-like n=1 Tax=Dendrobium catenatum TaxID=906689 RepID=UPI0010A00C19|nr:extensin-like [Dendrobium catenatum]